MSDENLGIATELGLRRKLYGDYAYQAPAVANARSHRITVNCATGERSVETIVAPPAKPKCALSLVVPAVAPVRILEPVRIRGAMRPRNSGNWRVEQDPRLQERIKDIVRAAAEAFGCTTKEMQTPCRARRVAYPRFAAVHLMNRVLRISTPSIGKVFGRDHSSVLHGLKKVAELRRLDVDFAYRSRVIARTLRKQWSVAGQAEAAK